MLRLLVLLLILANGAYFAWSQGLLAAWGYAPVQQSEPQRLTQQVRPQSIRVLSADELRRLEAGGRGLECLVAGPVEEAQLPALKQALTTWPAQAWSLEAGAEAGRWIIYMGRYPSPDFVVKKKAELRQLGVSFQSLDTPALEPGISLGGFASEAEAESALEALAGKGVRTARVVQERAELRGQMLRLGAVDDALRARLDELRPMLSGRAWRSCS